MPRCNRCAACTADQCSKCVFCLDTKRFGGPGRLRKGCIERMCLQQLEVDIKSKATALKSVRTTVSHKTGCAYAAFECGHCLRCLDKLKFGSKFLPDESCFKKMCSCPRKVQNISKRPKITQIPNLLPAPLPILNVQRSAVSDSQPPEFEQTDTDMSTGDDTDTATETDSIGGNTGSPTSPIHSETDIASPTSFPDDEFRVAVTQNTCQKPTNDTGIRQDTSLLCPDSGVATMMSSFSDFENSGQSDVSQCSQPPVLVKMQLQSNDEQNLESFLKRDEDENIETPPSEQELLQTIQELLSPDENVNDKSKSFQPEKSIVIPLKNADSELFQNNHKKLFVSPVENLASASSDKNSEQKRLQISGECVISSGKSEKDHLQLDKSIASVEKLSHVDNNSPAECSKDAFLPVPKKQPAPVVAAHRQDTFCSSAAAISSQSPFDGPSSSSAAFYDFESLPSMVKRSRPVSKRPESTDVTPPKLPRISIPPLSDEPHLLNLECINLPHPLPPPDDDPTLSNSFLSSFFNIAPPVIRVPPSNLNIEWLIPPSFSRRSGTVRLQELS